MTEANRKMSKNETNDNKHPKRLTKTLLAFTLLKLSIYIRYTIPTIPLIFIKQYKVVEHVSIKYQMHVQIT